MDDIFVTGVEYVSPGSYSLWTEKYDSTGELVWSQIIGGSGIVVDNNDSVYTTGGSLGWTPPSIPSTARMRTSDGNNICETTETSAFSLNAIATDGLGNIYLTGSENPANNIWVRKYSGF